MSDSAGTDRNYHLLIRRRFFYILFFLRVRNITSPIQIVKSFFGNI